MQDVLDVSQLKEMCYFLKDDFGDLIKQNQPSPTLNSIAALIPIVIN